MRTRGHQPPGLSDVSPASCRCRLLTCRWPLRSLPPGPRQSLDRLSRSPVRASGNKEDHVTEIVHPRGGAPVTLRPCPSWCTCREHFGDDDVIDVENGEAIDNDASRTRANE
jgi:hypothetical protein